MKAIIPWKIPICLCDKIKVSDPWPCWIVWLHSPLGFESLKLLQAEGKMLKKSNFIGNWLLWEWDKV